MKWKPDVTIQDDNGLWIRQKDRRLRVDDEYEDIVRLMSDGITEDEELIQNVAKKKDTNMIIAGLSLAQFVEDYSEFISEGIRDKVFS